ncbi:MAG: sporulation protein YqfD, partial [Clostridia bacterium]|nr:sporulation protein YqfD [Clostridia bacterium]
CYRAYEGDENKQVSYEVLGLSLSFPPFSTAPKKGERVLEFAEPLCFFGYRLPVVVREKIFLNSVEKKEEIEVDRAEKLAYDKYEQFKRDTFAESDEILWENVTLSTDEQGVTLTAELSAIEDICREVPFRFTAFPEEN